LVRFTGLTPLLQVRGMRQLCLTDPDGYQLCFQARL